jgi:RNA polymerase sigma-70 factor (ECF subfamily)
VKGCCPFLLQPFSIFALYLQTGMHSDHEKELLRQIKKDPQVFSVLYDRYYNPIFSYIFRRLGHYDQASDLTAEVFLKALHKIGQFEWRSIPISAWLYRIAANEINLACRKSKYKPRFIEDVNLHIYLQHEDGIETEKAALEKAFTENNEFVAVQKALLQLDEKYQEAIALRYFEDKSIKEIALITGKNEGTVKSLLSRGLEKLRTIATSDNF